jgi:hypothetical protein
VEFAVREEPFWSPDRTDLLLQVDHVMPVAGGDHRTDTCAPSSKECNQRHLDLYTLAIARSVEPDIEITTPAS